MGVSDYAIIVNRSSSQILAPVLDNELPRFVMRIALSNPLPQTNMVLEGLCALVSLQLLGRSQSEDYKNRLISMVRENISKIDKGSVLNNLIASMLLYQYEVCIASRGVLH